MKEAIFIQHFIFNSMNRSSEEIKLLYNSVKTEREKII